ncbi:MAG: hypothetical protein DMG30_01165 [Acidobacteria bacterium]|nr:MAG: hypothetical protein DMG30_01165 [Acidobacteriota bacterium]
MVLRLSTHLSSSLPVASRLDKKIPPPQNTTVILNYHRLHQAGVDVHACSSGDFYALGVENFRQQMVFLRRNSFKTLLLGEFLTLPASENSRNVVITFDDGYESDLTIAVPLLRQLGFRAVFFICVEHIDRPGYLSRDQVKQLLASGMSVQSHGFFHHDLTRLSYRKAVEELARARLVLERMLNTKISYLAIPGGFTNERVLSAALAAGYEAICTSLPGLARGGRKLNRVAIRRSTTQPEFEAYVRRKRIPILANSLRYRGASRLKQIVGVNHYEAIKLRLWQRKRKSLGLEK